MVNADVSDHIVYDAVCVGVMVVVFAVVRVTESLFCMVLEWATVGKIESLCVISRKCEEALLSVSKV
jgi:hypothetical protein